MRDPEKGYEYAQKLLALYKGTVAQYKRAPCISEAAIYASGMGAARREAVIALMGAGFSNWEAENMASDAAEEAEHGNLGD